MIKRTIYIGNPARLSKKDMQMVVEPTEGEIKSLPIEDIGLLILDDSQISITHALVNELLTENSAVLWCDNKHLPSGLILPMSANHIFTEKVRAQIEASEPLKKQLWQQTIQCKIKNQAALLKELGKQNKTLTELAKNVLSGDSQNIEARAAAYYWKVLFDELESFKRGRFEGPPNNLFNYGYAVLRAVVARNLVGSGMIPVLGIHHHNKYNAYCLADDIMEPYRPVVDRLVLKIFHEKKGEIPDELDKELKAALLQIPVLDVKIDKQTSPLMVGMQRTTASLMKCFEGEARKILYPEM